MNTKEQTQLKKFMDTLDIPVPRKDLNIHSVRWILRTKPKLDDRFKMLLSKWLRENDIE